MTVANGGPDANVSLRLDLGADDSNLANSRRKMTWTGEGSGTDTLTFEYTVNRHDADADGVWLKTAPAIDNTVVFLERGATITGGNPATNSAVLTGPGLATTGEAGRKLVGKSSQTFGTFNSSFLGDYGAWREVWRPRPTAIRRASAEALTNRRLAPVLDQAQAAQVPSTSRRCAVCTKPVSSSAFAIAVSSERSARDGTTKSSTAPHSVQTTWW